MADTVSIILSVLLALINIGFLLLMAYALKQFNTVRDHFIFKKRHSAITMVLVIMIIINTLNSVLILITDHILLPWIRFSFGAILLYQQYMSIYILILFTLCLKIWINYFDVNYSQTIINNEWKSLIDPMLGNGDNNNEISKPNWFIKHRNTFGNSKYWIRYLLLIYSISLISMYALEARFCWNHPDNYNKCYYYLDSFENFQYRQIVSMYENYVAVVFGTISWSFTGFIRYKTSSFEDNFHVRKEIQLLLIGSISILFNIPHAYVCYAIETKQYEEMLGTNDAFKIEQIWSISGIFTITQYNLFVVYGVYILTIWTIKKNQHWLKLFNGKAGNSSIPEMSIATMSARASFHLDPLHRKISDVALSTFNLSHINDEHAIHEKSVSSTESPQNASNNKKKIELDNILKNEDGFNSYIFHLGTEFSLEVLISLIEFYQYKYYIQKKLINTDKNNKNKEDAYFDDDKEKIQYMDILKRSNKMIPMSYIVSSNNFEKEEFARKYKLEYAKYIGMVYKKNTELKEYEDANKYQLLFESMIMSYELFHKYINIGSIAEININYFARQDLINIYENLSVGQFIVNIINDKLINGNSNIAEQIDFFYHIFDDCCEEMVKLMGYSYLRFSQTSLFKKLLEDKFDIMPIIK